MDYMKYSLIYIIFINVVSFIMFYVDKEKAKKDRWRIKERTLHITSFMGGTIGSILAMCIFHHKTKKFGFCFITALALCFNIFIVYMLFKFDIIAF